MNWRIDWQQIKSPVYIAVQAAIWTAEVTATAALIALLRDCGRIVKTGAAIWVVTGYRPVYLLHSFLCTRNATHALPAKQGLFGIESKPVQQTTCGYAFD